jgi:hypothetical protein
LSETVPVATFRTVRVFFTGLALSLASVFPCYSADPELCVKTYFEQKAKQGFTLGIQQDQADKLITLVEKRLGLAGGIELIPCTYERKAVSWEAPPKISVPEGRYIIYNSQWV